MEFSSHNTTVAVNVATKSALEARVSHAFAAQTGFALATINLDHLVKLRSSSVFREAYSLQDLVVADGNPIVWLSKLAGRPVELMPGSDLILPLSKLATEQGVSIAMIGSTEETLKAAAAVLKEQVPGLKIVYGFAPPMGFDPLGDTATDVLKQVAASGARLCFLALGAPKQETLAGLGRDLAPTVGFVSIGAGLDFIAGRQARAPNWVRKFALEWLWRAVTNPLRLGPRYIRCLSILPSLILNATSLRSR